MVLAACWHDPPPAHDPVAQPEPTLPMRPTRPKLPTCRTAVFHAVELARSDLESTPTMKDRFDQIRDTIVESCQTMEWSAETLGCFEGAAASDELRDCQQKLTAEQTADVYRRMTDIMAKPAP